jgi:serine/threonine-protein kinase
VSNAIAADAVTVSETMLGSPRYMSPEQIADPRSVDVRSDIWSIAVVLYELIAGAAPFAGQQTTETLASVLLHRALPLRDQRSDVPEGLEAIVSSCLERDRARRPPSALALAKALVPYGSTRALVALSRIEQILPQDPVGSPVAAPEAGLASAVDAQQSGMTRTLTRLGSSPTPPRSARWRWRTLAIGSFAAALAFAAYHAVAGRNSSAPADATPPPPSEPSEPPAAPPPSPEADPPLPALPAASSVPASALRPSSTPTRKAPRAVKRPGILDSSN